MRRNTLDTPGSFRIMSPDPIGSSHRRDEWRELLRIASMLRKGTSERVREDGRLHFNMGYVRVEHADAGSRPELPPLSLMATTAANEQSWVLSPVRVVWLPVPPPTTTICFLFIYTRYPTALE